MTAPTPLDLLGSNLHRRHLDESQRAMVAGKLTSLGVGANQHTKGEGTSIDVAAEILNVGRASIDRARKVLKSGDPALVEAVQKGDLSVSAAAALVGKEATKGDKSKKTAFDRLEDVWDKVDIPTQQAFVEAKYQQLTKLMKE